jgi:catechol 2,3-dioxygenase-like lactoylglutathione lyase family enzyme
MSAARPRSLVPLAHVADVARSVRFYERLGFTVSNTHSAPDGRLVWAWLAGDDGAALMVSLANGPVDAGVQAVLFYVYVADVTAWHGALSAAGVPVGPVQRPFYSPRGEFRLEDPDGYVLMVAHAD